MTNVLTAHLSIAQGRRMVSLAEVFPWLVLATSTWLVGGIYLDGWAHNHGKVDESFFTPWHAVLYSGYLGVAAVLVIVAAPGLSTRGWRTALPAGYDVSLLGVVVFGLAGVADMLWHVAFGIEVDIAALLSPTHLALALGASLIVAGPLSAAWRHPQEHPAPLLAWLPALASAALLYGVLAFMTQFAHPLVRPEAGSDAAYAPTGDDVYVMNADGTAQTRLTAGHGMNSAQLAWSPDGQHVALTTRKPAEHTGSLIVADINGGNQRVLASGVERAAPLFPTWSPDGGRLAFAAAREGPPQLWVIDLDGANERRPTTTGVVPSPLAWSPDGQRIAFTAERDGRRWIHVVDVNGGFVSALTEGVAPSWSPDGRRIAFGWDSGGTGEIYSIATDGTDLRRLTTTHSARLRQTWSWWPAWSPDGARIAFQSNRDGTIDVFAMDPDGGNAVNLTDNPSLNSFQPAWSPDGQRLAYTASGHADPLPVQALGITGILFHASLLSGIVLMLARRWRLPLGSCTAIFTLGAVLLSFLNDTFEFIPAACAAGVLADLLLLRFGQSRPRVVAFVVPAVFYAAYFVALALTQGIGWTIHLWAGSIVLAGVVGWLLSLLVLPPSRAEPA